MGWKEFKWNLAKILAPDLFALMQEGTTIITQLKEKIIEQQQTINSLSGLEATAKELLKKYEELDTKYTELRQNPPIRISSLEGYCVTKFKVIKNKSYKNKRKYTGKSINVYINQMITPDALEVKRLRFEIPRGESLSTDALNIGNRIAKDFTWTDDKNLDTSGDYYLYPEEIIVSGQGDCEDHAFTVASLNPEIDVAYGFLTKNGRKFGHAFNIFTENDKLYILDTVGDVGEISEYNTTSNYYIHYIITKNATFELDGSVEFGELVWGT